MKKISKLLKSKAVKIISVLLLQILIGAAAGAAAGWVVSAKAIRQGEGIFQKATTTSGWFSTSTKTFLTFDNSTSTSGIKLVTISSAEITPRLVPNVVLDRKSPVAVIYKNKVQGDFSADDEMGRAVAVTSDGWFATVEPIWLRVKTADLVLVYEQKEYKIEKALSDAASGVIFFKTNAEHLPVASFAQYYGQRVGTALWLEPRAKQFVPSALIATRADVYPGASFSDTSKRRLAAYGWIGDAEAGAPVWDTNGSLVGIVEIGQNGNLTLVPASIISESLQSLVTDGKIKHAALGVYTLNLSLQIDDASAVNNYPERGALISGGATGSKILPIVKGGVAEKAGLKIGDVILQVDRDIIDESSDLGDIILQFHPGAGVELRVWRDGQEMNIPITLGEQETSKVLP